MPYPLLAPSRTALVAAMLLLASIDKDHFKYEAFAKNPMGEGEMQVMEILYTRM